MAGFTLYGAPMAGITDKPFRILVRHFSSSPLYTEMVAASSYRRGAIAMRRALDIAQEKNIIVQLVGANVSDMIYTAQTAENSGAIGIDINMGCPVKKLITNGSGSAFLKTADKAAVLVEAVSHAVSIPVSVKTRLGWTDKKEILTFAPKMVMAGAKRIAVHARTKIQGFSGASDWKILKSVSLNGAELIVNGDIKDQASLKAALSQAGTQSALIGRALWGQPWLLATLETTQTPSFSLRELATEHLEHMLDFYGPKGLYAMRKHLAQYAKKLQKSRQTFCEAVFHAETPAEVQKLIQMFFKDTEKEYL